MVATYVTAFDEFLPKQLKFVECERKFVMQPNPRYGIKRAKIDNKRVIHA